MAKGVKDQTVKKKAQRKYGYHKQPQASLNSFLASGKLEVPKKAPEASDELLLESDLEEEPTPSEVASTAQSTNF
jgi:transposase